MILIQGSLSFAKLVMMSSAPAIHVGDARCVSHGPFIHHSNQCCPIQSCFQSVLGVHSFCVKCNNHIISCQPAVLKSGGLVHVYKKAKAMFTRDRFQMVPIQKSCRIGLLFTRDLLTVPSIRSLSGPKTGPPKKQVQFLEPFRSQTDPSLCKHPDRFLSADLSPCKHLDRFLLVLRRHFESYNVYSAHA